MPIIAQPPFNRLDACFDGNGSHMSKPHHDDERRFVLGALASAVMLVFAPGAVAASAGAAGAAPAVPAGIDAFLALSRKLTGRPGFDPTLARRVYDALSSADSEFAAKVAALDKWIATHGGTPSDVITDALQADQPKLAALVGTVMRAWYLGLAGLAPGERVIAYERALMFDPVSDVLTIPSYCRDAPMFYWTHNPASAA
ncbi:uridylyltransferase [Caballeronia choica]|uniref:Uridylyltransferase n=2 Tax=Caballeronia choica TaxID=326476 RepID=A0A158INR7_9BURK|nr:uridylyltransferase [Caballeronia choica]